MTIDMTTEMALDGATDLDAERVGWIRDRLAADVAAERYDGIAVMVGHRGRLVLAEAAGLANRETSAPMHADSVAICFSTGKQFVNTLVLRAVEKGLLGLHQPIVEVLPGFANRGKEGITLTHLLTHTSGICTGLPPVEPEVMLSIDGLTAWAAASRPENRPGERVCYSAIVAHAILASLLLAVDGHGRNFAQYLDDELFAPLGMTRTSLGVADHLRDEFNPLTTRYTRSGMFHAEEVDAVGAATTVPGAEIPAGGYVTTATDLHRFATMLAGGGAAADGARIVSPAMLEFASANRTGDVPNDLLDYSLQMRRWSAWPGAIGLGYFVGVGGITPGPLPNLGRPGTFGGWGSGTSCFWVDPTRELSFAMLTVGSMEDTEHIERTRALGDTVIAALPADA